MRPGRRAEAIQRHRLHSDAVCNRFSGPLLAREETLSGFCILCKRSLVPSLAAASRTCGTAVVPWARPSARRRIPFLLTWPGLWTCLAQN
jgi:hypothetical protein